MELKKLGTQEVAAKGGATHKVIITHADLTETTAATSQVLNVKNIVAGDLVKVVGAKLVTPFEDASDAAFNSNTVQMGDGSDADRFLAAMQVNENGTEIDYKEGTGTAKAYTAADTLDLTFGSMTAKSLSDLDAGELHVLVQVIEL